MKLLRWLDQFCSLYIDNPKHKSQANVICRGNVITLVYMTLYGVISFIIEFKQGVWIQSILILLFSIAFILLKHKVALDLVGNYIAAVGFMGVIGLCFYSGGLGSPVLPWISLVPIVSLLFSKQKWAFAWLIFVILVVLLFRLYFSDLTPHPVGYNTRYYELFYLTSLLGLITTYFFLNLIYKRSLHQSNEELELKHHEIETKNRILEDQSLKIGSQMIQITNEKNISDNLLKNILPEDIAERLKADGKTEARLYDQVSILFTDFVGFTQYCETISPQRLIKVLHNYFQAFDTIVEKYNLEKIKTIGDSYMAVSGLPKSNPMHAYQAVQAGLEIRDFVENYKINRDSSIDDPMDMPSFEIRIGIHSGTVIAGIIGSKKFAFDIWGDAVNTAARIQQIGAHQQVSISETTYLLVKDHFECEYQGRVTAKNKGELDLYFVNPRHSVATTILPIESEVYG